MVTTHLLMLIDWVQAWSDLIWLCLKFVLAQMLLYKNPNTNLANDMHVALLVLSLHLTSGINA